MLTVKITRTLRHARRLLQGGKIYRYSAAEHVRMATKAYYCVTAFYIVNLFFAYQTMYRLMDEYGNTNGYKLAIDPFWPVFFAHSQIIPEVAIGISLFYMGVSLLVTLWPHSRTWRFLTWIAIMQTTAFKYSFGVLNEKEQWWMWIALIFVFLPNRRLSDITPSLRQRQYYLDIFSFAQGMLLLIYSLIGLWKFYHISWLRPGVEAGLLWPDALAHIFSARLVVDHSESIWSPLVLEIPGMVARAIFIFISYIELFAIVIWFRPSLQRLWGSLLILLHVGTWISMKIVFYLQPPLLAILLLHSPFIRESEPLRKLWRQMPMVDAVSWFLKDYSRRRS